MSSPVRICRFSYISVLAAALLASSCQNEKQKKAPAIGEAFAGPITVELRDELSPNAKVVGKTQHGERLEILQTRRRFVKVRTPAGVEGWTDTRKLLTTAQMNDLKELSSRAAKIPSMGRATVYDTLNMHAEPNRYSASFYQVTPGVPVEVLTRRVTERTPPPPPEPIIKKPAVVKKPKAKKEKKEPKYPPPPMPAAPPVPKNWLELSKTDLPEEPDDHKDKGEPEEEPKKPAIFEDWTLVRTQNGKAGWVLSRMLQMSIPDEVAQYSEGARITSYFPLAEIDDEGQKKHHWLWTTVTKGGQDYDFDSFRVFIWNRRRHRYETSYIERGLQGYYPVQVEGPKFTVTLKNGEGNYYTKTFQLDGYISRWMGSGDAKPPVDPLAGFFAAGKVPGEAPPPPTVESKSVKEKVKEWFQGLFRRR
jgi:hypothetical protein